MLSFKNFANTHAIYQFIHEEESLYVGSSENLFGRIAKHINHITMKPDRENPEMYAFMKEHKNDITLDVLEFLDNDITNEQLRIKEQYWMDKQKPKFNKHRAYTTKQQAKEYRSEKLICPSCSKLISRGSMLKHKRINHT